MTYDDFRAHCLSKKGVEESHPFGPESVWFKVMGKLFSLTMLAPFTYNGEQAEAFAFVNLKCDPEKAVALRESYDAVRPGWHQSKKHWNSVMMDGSLEDALIREWIDESYALVVASLTKKDKAALSLL